MHEFNGRSADDANQTGAATSMGRSLDRTEDRVVVIHQPNYLPWLGYFHKIHRSDVFVFLDDVEYTSGSWTNRNKIKTPDGWAWLTVPVRNTSAPIESVRIVTDENWRERHRKSLQHNYGKARFFDEFADLFERVYEREWESLVELNVTLIRRLVERLDLECRFVRSSTLDVDGTKTDRLVTICETLGADRYLSGTGARSYIEPSQFEDAGITLEYNPFEYPQYEQRFGSFVPNLSIVDVVFNVGSAATIEALEDGGDR